MTTNKYLDEQMRLLKIPDYRGSFMADSLPSHARTRECGILNLDRQSGRGTHWTCWYVDANSKIYFDSYGANIPHELHRYLGSGVLHNDFQVQEFGTDICGDICVLVLLLLSRKISFTEIVMTILPD